MKNESKKTKKQSYEKKNSKLYHNENEKKYNWYEKNQQNDFWKNVLNANFVTSFNFYIVTHSCRLCLIKFTFKNKLFVHFRDECWKKHQKVNHQQINHQKVNHQKTQSMLHEKSILNETIKNRQLIQSLTSSIEFIDQAFRDCHYVTTKIKSFFNDKSLKLCLNIDCSMFIDDKQIFKKNFSNVIVKQFSFSILIRDINNIMHHISKYAIVFFLFWWHYSKKRWINRDDESIWNWNSFNELTQNNFFFR